MSAILRSAATKDLSSIDAPLQNQTPNHPRRRTLHAGRFGFLFTELLFPAQDARFVARLFGFGNHVFALIGARNRSPRKDICWVEDEDSLRGFDGAVEILLGVIGLREAMERVAKFRVDRQSLIVLRNCFREFSFSEKIDALVVMIFGGFGFRVAHLDILASVMNSHPVSGTFGGEAVCVESARQPTQNGGLKTSATKAWPGRKACGAAPC